MSHGRAAPSSGVQGGRGRAAHLVGDDAFRVHRGETDRSLFGLLLLLPFAVALRLCRHGMPREFCPPGGQNSPLPPAGPHPGHICPTMSPPVDIEPAICPLSRDTSTAICPPSRYTTRDPRRCDLQVLRLPTYQWQMFGVRRGPDTVVACAASRAAPCTGDGQVVGTSGAESRVVQAVTNEAGKGRRGRWVVPLHGLGGRAAAVASARRRVRVAPWGFPFVG